MNYLDVLDAIEVTERRFKKTKKQTTNLKKHFERYGCYDEDDAEEAWRKQKLVYTALTKLYAQLPNTVHI